MPICKICGEKFDLSFARRSIGASFGTGVYNSYYPEGDVCVDCAYEVISADYNAGQEIAELMRSSWYDD